MSNANKPASKTPEFQPLDDADLDAVSGGYAQLLMWGARASAAAGWWVSRNPSAAVDSLNGYYERAQDPDVIGGGSAWERLGENDWNVE